MGLLDAVLNRARIGAEGKAMLELHPEILERVHVMSARSDEIGVAYNNPMNYLAALNHYGSHVWVRKAVKVVADNIASLPLKVMRGEEEVKRHPLIDLLTAVNPETSSAQLWTQWVIDMLLGGEAGWELVKTKGGGYAEVWARQPHQVAIIPDKARLAYYGVAGYKVDTGLVKPYELPPDEMLFWKFYNPQSPWRGLSVIGAVRNGIGLDNYAQGWGLSFFQRQARPDYAIITPAGTTQKERDEIELKMSAKHRGEENWHKPVVLEEGVTDIKVLDFRPKDLEWVAQRAMSREEIGAIFGVPDEIMGWGRDTYENFDTALRVLWVVTLLPLASFRDVNLTEYAMRVGLLREGEAVVSDLSKVAALREDTSKSWLIAKERIVSGVMTINEYRKAEGLPPVPWGDAWWAPSSLVPVEDAEIEEPAPPPAPAQLPPPGEEPEEPEEEEPEAEGEQPEEEPKTFLPILREPAWDGRAEGLAYGSPGHRWVMEQLAFRQSPYIVRWARQMRTIFRRQQAEVIARLRQEAKGIGDVADDPFDPEAEAELTGKALRALLGEIFLRAAREAAEALGGDDFEVSDPRVASFLKLREQRFAEEVSDTTWERLKTSLNEGLENGETIRELEQRVEDVMGDRIRSSAETIARTEVNGAYNGGTLMAWEQSGVVDKKVWLAALDDRTRDSHVEAHMQEVALDEDFEVGGGSGPAPGQIGLPEEDINCRCSMVAKLAKGALMPPFRLPAPEVNERMADGDGLMEFRLRLPRPFVRVEPAQTYVNVEAARAPQVYVAPAQVNVPPPEVRTGDTYVTIPPPVANLTLTAPEKQPEEPRTIPEPRTRSYLSWSTA